MKGEPVAVSICIWKGWRSSWLSFNMSIYQQACLSLYSKFTKHKIVYIFGKYEVDNSCRHQNSSPILAWLCNLRWVKKMRVLLSFYPSNAKLVTELRDLVVETIFSRLKDETTWGLHDCIASCLDPTTHYLSPDTNVNWSTRGLQWPETRASYGEKNEHRIYQDMIKLQPWSWWGKHCTGIGKLVQHHILRSKAQIFTGYFGYPCRTVVRLFTTTWLPSSLKTLSPIIFLPLKTKTVL